MSDPKTPLELLLDNWDEDAKMNSTEPAKELLRIPALHAKYVRKLSQYSLLTKKTDIELARLKKRKWDYYSGRMDQDTLNKYGLKPFKFVLKGEVKDYVDADDEILELIRKKVNYEEIVSICNSILKELNSRTYQLRSFIDWEKFISGQ